MRADLFGRAPVWCRHVAPLGDQGIHGFDATLDGRTLVFVDRHLEQHVLQALLRMECGDHLALSWKMELAPRACHSVRTRGIERIRAEITIAERVVLPCCATCRG